MWYQQCWCLQQRCHQKRRNLLKVEAPPRMIVCPGVTGKDEDKLNLDGLSEWSPCNAAIARELLFSYHDIFALKPNMSWDAPVPSSMRFTSMTDKPFKECFRHIPLPLLEEVVHHLEICWMLVLSRPSQSPWCNTVVLVWKKDGSLWFCVDFRWPQCMDKERFISPTKDTRSAGEHGRSCTLLHNGFQEWILAGPHGPRVATVHRAFTVGNLGFYEFTRMPFGLCNTPATFQHLMQNTLGELNLTYCIIYLDDVIIFGHIEEHLKCLCVVFEHFWEFNLKLKPAKCSFFQMEIVYLVHHVSSKGIHPSKENVCAIKEFPMPETYTQVRAFCGLAGHYHHFIKGFALLVHPLYDILGNEVKMGPVMLPPEAQDAVRYDCWKKRFNPCQYLCFPILISLSYWRQMPLRKGLVWCSLRSKMMDATIPWHLAVEPWMPSKQNYHSSKLEFLALKWSVTEHFKEYLAYAPFTVHMDNNPLTYVLTTPNLDVMGHPGLECLHPMNSPWSIRKDQTMPLLTCWAEYLSDMIRIQYDCSWKEQ